MATSEVGLKRLFLDPTETMANPELYHNFEECKERATHLLLLRDFEGCIAKCRHGVALAKSNLEMDSSSETIEKLSLLGIQGYAEMDSWQTVLPFVQQVYMGIERCPSSVIQLCILLHAQVKEYKQCHAIASIWLKCPDNTTRSGYTDIVRLYVLRVMVPNGQKDLVIKFLQTCTALQTKDISEIMDEVDKLSHKVLHVAEAEKKCDHSQSRIEEAVPVEHHTVITIDNVSDWIFEKVKRIGVYLVKQFSYISLNTVIKIAFVMVCFYAAAIHSNLHDDLIAGLGRASLLWQGCSSTLISLFGPIRPRR